MINEKLYGARDVEELYEHFVKHLSAMTSEGLHSKTNIAAELAYRDSLIEQLEDTISLLEEEVSSLSNEVCELEYRISELE